MIRQLLNKNITDKFPEYFSIDIWRTLIDGMNVVYRFRNFMGAHDHSMWGEDQVATSCLILTFYLVDTFLIYFYK